MKRRWRTRVSNPIWLKWMERVNKNKNKKRAIITAQNGNSYAWDLQGMTYNVPFSTVFRLIRDDISIAFYERR